MTIRVVSIISRMNVGGPAVLLSQIHQGLPKDKFEHILITGRCLDNEIDYLESHPLDSGVIYIDSLQRTIFFLNDVLAFLKLVLILHKLKPDIVHTHTSKAGFLGRLAAKVANPKSRIIHTYHGHTLYGYFGKFLTVAIIFIEKFMSLITDELIAISTDVKDQLLKRGIGSPSKWRIIHVGIEIAKNRRNSSQKKIKEANAVRLGWIGRFADVKNPLLALKALSYIGESKTPLIMVGDGNLLPNCRAFAKTHNLDVKFTGWSNDIYESLEEVDLLLLTSVNEGFGLVILEAATQGIPTLATNVGGVSDFITDGQTGFLSDESVSDYSSRLSSLLNNPDLIEVVGKNCLTKVIRDFSSEKFVDAHIELYLSQKN